MRQTSETGAPERLQSHAPLSPGAAMWQDRHAMLR